jgi:hypothetical protein
MFAQSATSRTIFRVDGLRAHRDPYSLTERRLFGPRPPDSPRRSRSETCKEQEFSAVALAVELQNMDMVGEAIEQRAGETLALEDARPFLKRKI